MTKKNRLFVPLSTSSFLDFKNGKQYEVRAYGRQFTEKNVYFGRDVELRKGYSGESIFGSIKEVLMGSLEEIFAQVDFKLIEPRLSSVEEAILENKNMLGEKDKYISFQVLLNFNIYFPK